MKKWLNIYEWPAIGKAINMVQQFKYLGGQISATNRLQAKVLRARFARAIAIAHKLVYLNISIEKK